MKFLGANNAIVEEIKENIMHFVTDNKPSYKVANKKLTKKRQHLSWIPCVTHSINLMLKDIGKESSVPTLVNQA